MVRCEGGYATRNSMVNTECPTRPERSEPRARQKSATSRVDRTPFAATAAVTGVWYVRPGSERLLAGAQCSGARPTQLESDAQITILEGSVGWFINKYAHWG